jgi:hypothetical protein
MANKRGQMKMSFGMIFSIILIVIFIAVASYAIMKFLGFQKQVQVGQFVNNLQQDVDKMEKGSYGSVEQSYNIPSKINYLCFTDFSKPSKGPKADLYSDFQLFSSGEENNMFFYPFDAAEGHESVRLNHIDVVKITEQENPYCITSSEGKIKIGIKKDIGDTLVTLTRTE